MSDETLYYTALTRLSSITSGSTDFEKVCRIIIKFMYPEYNFKVPEGGQGTKDGGYDGYDPIKKTKLAYSIDKDYKTKIESEIEKSVINGDLEIFYLSNQIIPEVWKKDIKTKYAYTNIKLVVFGIDILSREIENYCKKEYDPELYDLLSLHFLSVGEYYKRGDAEPFIINYNGKIYNKRIVINETDLLGKSRVYAETKISPNPLSDFVFSCCSDKDINSFKNITLCGIGYLGKSFLMETTYNALIKEFSNKKNYPKYQYIPFVKYYKLKNYTSGLIKNEIKNHIDPLLIFLDGLDEINETNKINLDKEIQNIINFNARIRFVVSGRNSSFMDFSIFQNSYQLYLEKYEDNEDMELVKLLYEYRNSPIADLLSIPTYRNFISENKISKYSKLEDFYSLLVKSNLLKDKERSDYSNEISKRMASGINIEKIIMKLSDFCYYLFIINTFVFTEKELKNYFKDVNLFIFVINSSIIEYRDIDNISFISNFYFEYFVSNALLTKSKKIVYNNFFVRKKMRIPLIDILVLFLSCSKTKSKELYDYIMEKIINDNIVYILLSEFDVITNSDRFKYFIGIFKKYKKDKTRIYYGRFSQTYSPLKNINNMSQRMQQLLPMSYRLEALKYLQKEINNYLKKPSKEGSLSFGNAICLLIPFIDDLWSKNDEQNILEEISLPLIKFFLFNELSKELNSILSEKFIFDWYKAFNWTKGWNQTKWESFYFNISGYHCSLLSEISDENEFAIKFNFLSTFYDDVYIKLLLLPILRYAMKNIYPNGYVAASFVSDEIADESECPVIELDDRVYILGVLKKLNV